MVIDRDHVGICRHCSSLIYGPGLELSLPSGVPFAEHFDGIYCTVKCGKERVEKYFSQSGEAVRDEYPPGIARQIVDALIEKIVEDGRGWLPEISFAEQIKRLQPSSP